MKAGDRKVLEGPCLVGLERLMMVVVNDWEGVCTILTTT